MARTIDAEAAARAVLSGRATAIPKSGDGPVEAIRSLETAHESAVHDRVEAINQFKSMMFRAPNSFRDVFTTKTFHHQLNAAVRFRTTHDDLVEQELRVALKMLAQRIRFLEGQIDDIESRLRPIIAEHYPALLGLHGVGPHSAAQLLIAAGDNADRLHSDAAFAKLCAACSQPASSGKTVRYRLDRGGSRKANRALYRIVIVRMRHDEATRRYVARRVEEGKTKSEIIRCLKRFVAREIFAGSSTHPTPDRRTTPPRSNRSRRHHRTLDRDGASPRPTCSNAAQLKLFIVSPTWRTAHTSSSAHGDPQRSSQHLITKVTMSTLISRRFDRSPVAAVNRRSSTPNSSMVTKASRFDAVRFWNITARRATCSSSISSPTVATSSPDRTIMAPTTHLDPGVPAGASLSTRPINVLIGPTPSIAPAQQPGYLTSIGASQLGGCAGPAVSCRSDSRYPRSPGHAGAGQEKTFSGQERTFWAQPGHAGAGQEGTFSLGSGDGWDAVHHG